MAAWQHSTHIPLPKQQPPYSDPFLPPGHWPTARCRGRKEGKKTPGQQIVPVSQPGDRTCCQQGCRVKAGIGNQLQHLHRQANVVSPRTGGDGDGDEYSALCR